MEQMSRNSTQSMSGHASGSTRETRVGGISNYNRQRLGKLHQRSRGPFTTIEAAKFLDLETKGASRLLRYLESRGWLSRVRRGLYITVPLEALQDGEWREDPWVVLAKTFSPCYIGGWSALEYWGLTEQMFRDVFIVTARRVRHRRVDLREVEVRIKVLPESKIFGTRSVWRGQTRVQVSDPSRTLVDVLDDPAMGGGIRNISDVIFQYFDGEYRDDAALISYADILGNHTVFKRLGYLLEALHINADDIVEQCLIRRSAGVTRLDPSVVGSGHVSHRWSLRINVAIAPDVEHR